MDLLSKRYASPFLLLDESIQAGCMTEFIGEFIDIVNQETENESIWEFFLHKIYDKSYQDFLAELKQPKQPNQPEKPVDFGTAINESRNILDGFVPE